MEPVKFCEKIVTPCTSSLKCVVPGCEKKKSENANLSFHLLPAPKQQFVYITDHFGNKKQFDRLEAWKLVLKLKTTLKSNKVCSLHFTNDDYLFPDVLAKNRVLKKSAVPSCNLPGKKFDLNKFEINKARQQRILNREKNKKVLQEKQLNYKMGDSVNANEKPTELQNECKSFLDSTVFQNVSDLNVTSENVSISENMYEQNFESTCEDCEPCESVSENVFLNSEIEGPLTFDQVKENTQNTENIEIHPHKKMSFIDQLGSDKDLSTATGIESFKILETIIELVKLAVGERFEKKSYIMKTRDRIIMTYVKLKQNLSYSFMAIMFNIVTSQHCKNIFCETVQILSKVLRVAIRWPSKEEIRRNLPKCFEDFENTRVILDCTEIFIQRPKKLCCQILTYSHYKGHSTVKVMTGVTPAGDISFVSKPYGGRVSDSRIFEQSDLMKLLEAEDAIMVDRGFLIEDICNKNQWKCIKPPYLRDKSQFTFIESVMTAKIAKARVHIERSNQRIKNFNILGSTMAVNLVRYFEDIIITICGTVNLSLPIMKDDKFMNN